MLGANFFLDTNIIIYSFDDKHPEKQQISQDLIEEALAGMGCISPQVVQESLNILTSKLKHRITLHDAVMYLKNTLLPITKNIPLASLYSQALSVQDRYKYSFYDSLSIAAALEMGCKTLYSEDLQHKQKIDGLKIINPFKPK